jgi:hypothetical protein
MTIEIGHNGVLLRCVRCGTTKDRDFQYIAVSNVLLRDEKELKTLQYPHDVYLCSKCFKKWGEFYHSKDYTEKHFMWYEAWKIFEEEFRFLPFREVVEFT